MKKLIKVDKDANIYELYSEYYVNLPGNHAELIPIDHLDYSIINSKLVDNVVTNRLILDNSIIEIKIANNSVTTSKFLNLNVLVSKLEDYLNLTKKTVLVRTLPILK